MTAPLEQQRCLVSRNREIQGEFLSQEFLVLFLALANYSNMLGILRCVYTGWQEPEPGITQNVIEGVSLKAALDE
jgi:hypothetical protein